MPNTSTPVRPTRLQRRANSDAAYSNSSSISSGYPSHGPSLESSLDSSDASRRFYQHQQSTVSTTSTVCIKHDYCIVSIVHLRTVVSMLLP